MMLYAGIVVSLTIAVVSLVCGIQGIIIWPAASFLFVIFSVFAGAALVYGRPSDNESEEDGHPKWYVDHIRTRNQERSQEKLDLEAVPSEWIQGCTKRMEEQGFEGRDAVLAAILAYLDRMHEVKRKQARDEDVRSYEQYRFMGPG